METIKKPEMPILRETPDQIYQRMANRMAVLAQKRGEAPPAMEEGEMFYDLLYPLAEEISEQQQLLEYSFLQGFLPWADGEFLEAHGYAEGVDPKSGEDEEAYRNRILEGKRSDDGNGRIVDYERWALAIEGVGGVVAVEHERNEVSVDLYITDTAGQPVTPEVATSIRNKLEEKRIAGHDLKCYPAEIFQVTIQVKLLMADESKREAAVSTITQRLKDYLNDKSLIVYQQLGAIFWVDGVLDYTSFTLNGRTDNLTKPTKAVSVLQLVVLP
ncbi:baseplate J/gp47 family protein [Bacillus thuringiensis]|nr:baseplate J/gp47 family protein [Bacillus thuringiensis]